MRFSWTLLLLSRISIRPCFPCFLCRLPVDEVHGPFQLCELPQFAAFRRNHEQLWQLPLERDEGQVCAVRAPAHATAGRLPESDLPLPITIEAHDTHVRYASLD